MTEGEIYYTPEEFDRLVASGEIKLSEEDQDEDLGAWPYNTDAILQLLDKRLDTLEVKAGIKTNPEDKTPIEGEEDDA